MGAAVVDGAQHEQKQHKQHQCGLLGAGPLVVPELSYQQELFAVKVFLDQPLVGLPDIRRLIALCAIADAHIERAIRLNSVDMFEESVLTDVENMCKQLFSSQPPVETLEALQLFRAFPYLEQGLTTGRLQQLDTHPGSTYLAYVANMNQLVMMATQIYHDACRPEHHKYIAHQMALLYQCLNQLQGDTKPIRRVIETRFEEVKATTESSNPFFELEASDWLQEVSWLCREEVKACPAYIHRRMSLLLTLLHQDAPDLSTAKAAPAAS